MAVKTEAQLITEWAALGDLHALTETDWLEGMRSLQAGGSLAFPLPTNGTSTSVNVDEAWTLLNPWTVAFPASGKGVICSTAAGTMTIESGGDGQYSCGLELNGSIAGIVQTCELALRGTRDAVTYYLIQGGRIDTAGVMTHMTLWAPALLSGETPMHLVAGDVLALYGRTGPGGGNGRVLTIHSASMHCQRVLPS